MDISKKEQTQKAGDNAVQTQIENQHNYHVTFNDKELIRAIATEICSKEMMKLYRMCTQDAIELANKRDNLFAQIFIPRIEKLESSINALKDPSFQFMIQNARETAVKTERKEDWELLSELLSCHVLKGEDRKIDAGISHAIKIIDEIDNDSLCALTTICAFEYFSPVSGSISEGLNSLNELFEKLLYLNLPTGINWLEHLDMLGALRILPLDVNQSKDYLCSKYAEYACAGIKKDTDEFKIMNDILADNNLSPSNILENECMEGYVRLNIVSFNEVLPEYKDLVAKIKNLYSKDNNANNIAREHFIGLWDSYYNLKKVRTWWDRIPNAFDVSLLGRVLAQTNAKRVYPSAPDLI